MKLRRKPLRRTARRFGEPGRIVYIRSIMTEAAMLRFKVPLAVLLAAGLAVPASGAPRPQESWGKAGVSFEDYRNDAVECGRLAYYADISETDHAKAFVSATKRLEAADDHGMAAIGEDDMYRLAQLGARSEQIRASIRPEKRMRELHAGLVQVVEICLEERGYSRFALTDEQRKELGKLKKGSAQRHRFMHALASDPQVLRTQEIASG
jgi:hypothetical protein